MSEKKYGHPLACVSPNAIIGKDVMIWQFASVLDGAEIGANVSIGACAEVGRGCKIGENTRISRGAFLPSNSIVGRNVFIGPGTIFCDDRTPRANTRYTPEPPIVEDNASIGAGVVVLPGVRIGWGAMVGAGSVLTKDVPPKTIVHGEPARIMKPLGELTCP